MKNLYILISILLLTFQAQSIDTKAEQAIVIDYDTNEILFEEMASMI